MKQSLYDELSAYLAEIRAQRKKGQQDIERLQREVVALAKKEDHLGMLLSVDPAAPSSDIDFSRFSLHDNLVEIANRREDRLLITKEATREIFETGHYATKPDVNKHVHTALSRSNHFRRVSRGVYRYHQAIVAPEVEAPEDKSSFNAMMDASKVSPSDIQHGSFVVLEDDDRAHGYGIGGLRGARWADPPRF